MRYTKLTVCLVTAFLALVIRPAALPVSGYTQGRELVPFSKKLKAGDYTWHPEISPAGPVVVLVNLPQQMMYVYRNGVRIGKSTVSTGAKGHSTPTGVFTVLQKKIDHESSIYKGAKMPHMQRLSWTGIAMHAGHLPGYPASHGCVRLPEEFAERLYSVTTSGTTVIIEDNNSGPKESDTPGLIFAGHKGEKAPPGQVVWRPQKTGKGPVSVIISAADQEGYVYRNGVEIGRAPVGKLGRIRGTHAYSATAAVDSNGHREWLSVASVGGRTPNLKKLAANMDVDPVFLANMRGLVTPGTSMIVTDARVNASTHSGSDFNIIDAEGPKVASR